MKRCYRETRGWCQREEGRWWSVSGLSASAARGENNVWCGRCNLLCWWHCLKKNSGKKKAEVNFCGRYQSWRAPWIVIESSAGNKIACKPITAVWEGGKDLFFSLCFLRGGLLIELCKLPGCGPPPAVISSDIGSNNHATNHLGSSLTLSVDWKERVGLSQHQCWFTAPCAALTLTSAVCVGLCVKKWGLPKELDLMHKGDLTTIGLRCVLNTAVKDGLFPCQGLGGHTEVVALSHQRHAQIKRFYCLGSNGSLIQIKCGFDILIIYVCFE